MVYILPVVWCISETGTYLCAAWREMKRPWGGVTREGLLSWKKPGSFSFLGFSSSTGFSYKVWCVWCVVMCGVRWCEGEGVVVWWVVMWCDVMLGGLAWCNVIKQYDKIWWNMIGWAECMCDMWICMWVCMCALCYVTSMLMYDAVDKWDVDRSIEGPI